MVARPASIHMVIMSWGPLLSCGKAANSSGDKGGGNMKPGGARSLIGGGGRMGTGVALRLMVAIFYGVKFFLSLDVC